MYASAGMGHVKASEAVEQAFKVKYGDEVEVSRIDILAYVGYIWCKILRDGYHYISAKRPQIWLWFYKRYNHTDKQKTLTILSRWAVHKNFFADVVNFKPDFFIATHPLPVRLLFEMERDFASRLPIGTMITDFGYHSYWISECVDFYFVASDFSRQALINNQTPADHIVITGIPIAQKFCQKLDPVIIRKKLGLASNKKTILIVGGQFNLDVLQKIISGIQQVHHDNVQFIVVAGRDKYLKAALENSDLGQHKNVKVFGFVDNMEEMMTVSDVIFSKAGGLTVSECMAKGLPMVINQVIPGQEEDNVSYLVAQGAAIKVNDFSGIVNAVNDLLANPQKINAMKKAARSIGKPNAAVDLADFVYQKITK